MMDFLRKYQVHFLTGILIFFLVSIAGMGTSFFIKSPNDAVVEVDGEKVPVRTYWSHYYRSLDPSKPLDKAAQTQKRDETIRDLVQAVVFKRETERFGIHVPDSQVAVSLTQIPAFQTKGQFNPQLYMEIIQSRLKMTPQAFEEEQRDSIGFFKLRWLIQSTIKVTDKEMDLTGEYPGFAKANRTEETDVRDEKTGKVTGHKKRPRTDGEIRELYRKKLWDEKTLYCFNQWLTQIGQKLRVKPHLDVLEGGVQG